MKRKEPKERIKQVQVWAQRKGNLSRRFRGSIWVIRESYRKLRNKTFLATVLSGASGFLITCKVLKNCLIWIEDQYIILCQEQTTSIPLQNECCDQKIKKIIVLYEPTPPTKDTVLLRMPVPCSHRQYCTPQSLQHIIHALGFWGYILIKWGELGDSFITQFFLHRIIGCKKMHFYRFRKSLCYIVNKRLSEHQSTCHS